MSKNNNKHRVVIVLPWDNMGAAGIEQQMLLFAGNRQNKDLEWIFFPLLHREEEKDEVMALFPSGVSVEPIVAVRARNAFFPLVSHLKKRRPDLLVGGSTHLGSLCLIAKWFSLARTRLLTMNQGFDRSHWKSRLHTWFTTKFSNRVIAVSHELEDQICSLVSVSEDRVIALPNPFDFDEIRRLSKEEVGFKKGQKKNLVYVGRLEEGQKNLFTLLEAMRDVDAVLHLVGDGPDRERYEKWVLENGLQDRILFEGWQTNPYAWIAKADTLVLSSRYEGFGRVLVEAMILGVQVVSTSCPSGPSEILGNGLYGQLVPVGDSNKLAKAIQKSFDQLVDPNELVRQAEKYDVDVLTPEFEQILLDEM